ncbi:hypothetical protein P154DRAFT_530450 [Amniculicola lignicola CBS 123094]|uniref:AP-1 complex subunit sigma-1 n=1 Tax=Amniculicola lignicola CBS 123094 TaxID=1392246 RepID=A0A6A5X1J5_9PLEO|nr:hypothetical protein P154DRAFT_530450 [Amniculicola lignicola CBS 123094]
MAIKYLILLSRQGKVRLAKWFTTLAPKDKAKIVKDVSQLVLARRTRMCNFLEYKDTKIVYRRYASLFFIAGCDSVDNELITLEIVHRYVEQMDKYYGNVCELDIIFNFQKAYFILDELLLAGEMQESSKKNVLRCIGQQDSLEDMEDVRRGRHRPSTLEGSLRDCWRTHHLPFCLDERMAMDVLYITTISCPWAGEHCADQLASTAPHMTMTVPRPNSARTTPQSQPHPIDNLDNHDNHDTPHPHPPTSCPLPARLASGRSTVTTSLRSQPGEVLIRCLGSAGLPTPQDKEPPAVPAPLSPHTPPQRLESQPTPGIMKYLDLCALHEVNLALNFDTLDSAVIGGCDIWTTKAAGSDKKLYKRIENTLETRHKDLLASVAVLSPEAKAKFVTEQDVERDTPFGSFNEPANRHTFAYLIATLNATHVDYDFANVLNPDEFRRETRKSFMNQIDTTMYFLRPQIYATGLPTGSVTPLGSPIWSFRSWQLIDSEMILENCECYVWEPSDDPYADDGAIWSFHYFLYNKEMKRVCYFYLRGISALSSSPSQPMSLMSKFKQSKTESSANAGSRKRAEYWLGDHAKKTVMTYGESDELDDMVIDHPDDVVDREDLTDMRHREVSLGADYYSSEDDSDVESLREREKSAVRAMSEHMVDMVDVNARRCAGHHIRIYLDSGRRGVIGWWERL